MRVTTDSLVLWFSIAVPMLEFRVWQLLEQGQVVVKV